MHPYKRQLAWVYVASFIALALNAPASQAQTSATPITLASVPSPAIAQPGVTVLTLVASNIPAGTITPANLGVTLQVASGATGPALTAQVSAYAAIPGSGGRITFQVLGPNVTAPTPYTVSVTGKTSTGVTFVSTNTAALMIDPSAQILSIVPSSARPGQTLTVTITGLYTNYVQGATNANFGPGISLAGGTLGQTGFVTVTSATTATVQLTIDPSATGGPRTVTLATGIQQANLTAGFSVTVPPSLLSVSPNSGQQGQTGLTVTITGQFTHFVQGITTADFGAGIAIASLVLTSPTSAVARLNLDIAASIGGRTVTLTTGSEIANLSNGFTVSSSANVCTALPSGLVGWWPGEANANDISGNQLNGNIQGGVTFVPGLVDQAFNFDGITGLVNVPVSAQLDIRGAITINGWIKPNAFQPFPVPGTCGGESCGVIAGKPFGYQLVVQSDGRLKFAFATGGNGPNQSITSITPVSSTDFTFVAATYDSSTGAVAIYINGVLDNTIQISGLMDSTNKPFQIGGFSDPALLPGDGAFAGVIDEVTLFGRALSGAEIQAIFTAGTAGQCKNTPVLLPELCAPAACRMRAEV